MSRLTPQFRPVSAASRLLRMAFYYGVTFFLSAAFLVSVLDFQGEDLPTRSTQRGRTGRHSRQRVCHGVSHASSHCQVSAVQHHFSSLEASSSFQLARPVTDRYELARTFFGSRDIAAQLPFQNYERPPPMHV